MSAATEFTAEEVAELRKLLEVEKIRKLRQLYSQLMDGGEIADGRQEVRNHLALGLDRGHGDRRRLHVCEELRDHVRAEGIEAHEQEHQHGEAAANNDEPFTQAHRLVCVRGGFGFTGRPLQIRIVFGRNGHVRHFLEQDYAKLRMTRRCRDRRR